MRARLRPVAAFESRHEASDLGFRDDKRDFRPNARTRVFRTRKGRIENIEGRTRIWGSQRGDPTVFNCLVGARSGAFPAASS